MLVGIISDTHDNLPMIRKVIDVLNRARVQLVLHAGDYVATFVIPLFQKLDAKMIGVFGNNDGDHDFLARRFSENPNIELRGTFANLTVGHLRLALLHGSDTELLKALVENGGFNVVVHGHTHEPEIIRKSKTLVIVPGEVCGYLTGKSTVAFLDTESKRAKIVQL